MTDTKDDTVKPDPTTPSHARNPKHSPESPAIHSHTKSDSPLVVNYEPFTPVAHQRDGVPARAKARLSAADRRLAESVRLMKKHVMSIVKERGKKGNCRGKRKQESEMKVNDSQHNKESEMKVIVDDEIELPSYGQRSRRSPQLPPPKRHRRRQFIEYEAVIESEESDEVPESPPHVPVDETPTSPHVRDPDYLIQYLEKQDWYRGQIVYAHHIAGRLPEWGQLTHPLNWRLQEALAQRYCGESHSEFQFYSHQAKAINALFDGRDIMVSTSTSSGKSLIFNVPVLHWLIEDPEATAIYIYPTKALAQDQLRSLRELIALFPHKRQPPTPQHPTPQHPTPQHLTPQHGLSHRPPPHDPTPHDRTPPHYPHQTTPNSSRSHRLPRSPESPHSRDPLNLDLSELTEGVDFIDDGLNDRSLSPHSPRSRKPPRPHFTPPPHSPHSTSPSHSPHSTAPPSDDPIPSFLVDTLDGDTKMGDRQRILNDCRVILVNPDILHLLLKNHRMMKKMFSSARYIRCPHFLCLTSLSSYL
eukprot:GHVN01037304.1.p1 GENE.GHVN01037304.1~~GHVN01037304.1.p1  ORF type:complete len:529 (+),score=149.74 GHVN01037304.1:92-1678(+)